jgi:hypothetical protein
MLTQEQRSFMDFHQKRSATTCTATLTDMGVLSLVI